MGVYKGTETKDGRKYFFKVRYKNVLGETLEHTSGKYLKRETAAKEEALFLLNVSEKTKSNFDKTIDDIWLEYSTKKAKTVKKQTTIRWKYYYKYLEPIKNVQINKLDLPKYEKFLKELDKVECDVQYKNKILGILRQIINYSARYYNTSDNILKYMDNYKEVNKQRKEMQYFTYEEFQQFISVVDDLKYKTLFETLFFLGIRQGELQALTWDCIKGKELDIHKTLTTKIPGELFTISTPKTANSYRKLPIPDFLYNDLMELKKLSQDKKKFNETTWFIFGSQLPIRESTIQKRKNAYCDLAGVKRIRVHDFRHSCTCYLIQKLNANITLVSHYLGHSKVSITLDIYNHLYTNELNDITAKINQNF